jgi:hypothetical protein
MCGEVAVVNKILYVVVFQYSSFGLPYWVGRIEHFD